MTVKPLSSVIQLFRETKIEMGKVVWPKRKEVVRLTMVVISISTIVAIYIGALDFLFTKILELVIK